MTVLEALNQKNICGVALSLKALHKYSHFSSLTEWYMRILPNPNDCCNILFCTLFISSLRMLWPNKFLCDATWYFLFQFLHISVKLVFFYSSPVCAKMWSSFLYIFWVSAIFAACQDKVLSFTEEIKVNTCKHSARSSFRREEVKLV